jgi:hypothetical protein
MATKDETPYIAIHLLSNVTVGRYASPNDAYLANPGMPIDVSYKPRKRITKTKEFPYNG